MTPANIPGVQSLNPVEHILIEIYPVSGAQMISSGGQAYSTNRLIFSNGQQNNNENGNAFQHAYWNYLMTMTQGYDMAKMWGDAHEYGLSGNVGGIEFKMDMANNESGRQLALQSLRDMKNYLKEHPFHSPTTPIPGFSATEYHTTVLDAVTSGNLLRIQNGALIPTNTTRN